MKNFRYFAAIIYIVVFIVATLNGCISSQHPNITKSGAQLWGENCIRCHNAPSPDTFSDLQWDIAVTHMRVRATLTKEETTKVLEFLKSAN